MKLRGFKRIAVSLAAASAMVGGLALTAPATASAATEYERPVLQVEQGDFASKNVKVTITNPNKAAGIDTLGNACTPALLDGTQALEALVAYENNDYAKLVSIILAGGPKVGNPAINALGQVGKIAASTWQVNDGVYVLIGVCGGVASLGGDVGVAINPVIVPSGIGSVAPALDFASVAGPALPALISLMAGGGSS